MIQISDRLKSIAEMVTEGNTLADVGCDHAFLAIWLIQNEKIPSAVVSDVREGPLSRAIGHVKEAGLTDRIEARLSDGLSAFSPGEAESLVIAGMGGPLMEKILSGRREVRDSFRELILQPQSDVPHFRRYLMQEGFSIVEEKMVEEEGKFYPMMRAVPSGASVAADKEPWQDVEVQYGRFLLKDRSPVLKRFLDWKYRQLEQILLHLSEVQGIAAEQRKSEIRQEMREIRTAKRYYGEMEDEETGVY